MTTRFRQCATVGLVLAIALAGCTKVQTSSASGRHTYTIAHTLRLAGSEDLVGLNPLLSQQAVLGYLSQMTMAWLIRGNRASEPVVPELATVVPSKQNGGISPDGLTITFHLRHGVKWSDGVPFDADDVVFSTGVVLDPKTNVASRDGWDDIVRIGEPDKYTVVYHLKRPYAPFPVIFFSSVGANPCILPKHLLLGRNINTDPYNALPVGIGPFRYSKWKRGDSVELEANPYYFRGEPKLQHVIYSEIQDRNVVSEELRTHELDLWIPVAPHYLPDVRSIPGIAVNETPSFYYDHIDFNNQRPIFRDLAVRQALRMAVNRPLINEKIRFGAYDMSESVVPPVSSFHENLPFVAFDLAGANKLLDGAGWRRGKDGIRAKGGRRLSLDVALASGSPDADSQLLLIRGWWSQLGVDVQVKHYLSSLFFAAFADGGILYTGKFDAIVFAWGGDPIQDLSPLYGCGAIPPAGQNDSRWCDPVATALMDKTKVEYDPSRRTSDMKAIQEYVDRDAPIIVLDTRKDIAAYNDDLKNWHPSSIAPFDDMMNVDI